MRRVLSMSLVALALSVACSSGNDNTDDPLPEATTVFAIQSGDLDVGDNVVLTDVVIMAVSLSGDRVWVSDALAAAGRTGVEVYRGGGAPAFTLAVGAHVEVEGVVQEFGQGSGLTVTQIVSPEFTQVAPATGSPVPLTGLDPAIITQDPIAGVSAFGEAYEGVLIQLANLEVSGTSPFTLSDGTTTFGAGAQVVPLTDVLGTCYTTVTGIWNYDVATDEWIIVPVPAGLVAGGTCT